MSPAAQTPDSVSPRRSKGSSRRAAARGGRSRGASRASLLGRLVIALVLIAAGVGVAWWTVQSTDRSQVDFGKKVKPHDLDTEESYARYK